MRYYLILTLSAVTIGGLIGCGEEKIEILSPGANAPQEKTEVNETDLLGSPELKWLDGIWLTGSLEKFERLVINVFPKRLVHERREQVGIRYDEELPEPTFCRYLTYASQVKVTRNGDAAEFPYILSYVVDGIKLRSTDEKACLEFEKRIHKSIKAGELTGEIKFRLDLGSERDDIVKLGMDGKVFTKLHN